MNRRSLRLGPSMMHRRPFRQLQGSDLWLPLLFPEGEHEQEDPDDDDDEKDDDADKDDEDPEGDDSKGDRDPQKKIKALEDEKNRHWEARKKAEKRADDLDKRLRALEDKDKPELERRAAQADEFEKENSKLKDDLRQTRLENSFLADNTYEWHNPSRALKLVDLSSVEIDEDGKVHGLSAALEALAKSDSYLIKSKEGSKGGDNKDKKDPADGKPGTGDSSNGSKSKNKGPDRAALEAKYPGLRR